MRQAKTKLDSGALADLALSFATQFVDSLNSKSLRLDCDDGLQTATHTFEQVRKSVIRKIVAGGAADLSFRQLIDAYEFLLNQRLSLESGRYSIVICEKEKRRHGVFYTPDELAAEVTTMALKPLVLRQPESDDRALTEILSAKNALIPVEKQLALRIVDPAMGAGTFLQLAAELLTNCVLAKLSVDNNEDDWNSLCKSVEEHTDFRGVAGELKSIEENELRLLVLQVVAQQCLYGTDVDAAAVDLAKAGLALRCGLPAFEGRDLFPSLRCGNALLGLRDSGDRLSLDFECLKYFSALLGAPVERQNCSPFASRMRVFHWALEFPEVFSGENPGFDLVLTNPPWEIEKANSREFFSRYDPGFMTLSKQAALARQRELMAQDGELKREWEQYLAYHEGFGAFVQAHTHHQGGGDCNAYKLFLELGYHLLKEGGVMAQIVPSGIYSDKGATGLRRLFIEKCRWLFLRGYHNREGLFSIHRSFKFCTIGVIKGGSSHSIDCNFLRVAPGRESSSFTYRVETLSTLSPVHLAFMETNYASDLTLAERLAERCKPLGSYPVSFRREFDMTNDSKLFVERTTAQKDGYAPDVFGHWLKGDWRSVEMFDSRHEGEFVLSADRRMAVALDDIKHVLLPVYEGRMIGQYDWAKKAWLQGKGRRAEWSELPFWQKSILPQYLLDLDTYIELQPERGVKIAYLAVGASTNSRTCIAAMIGDWPCGNSVPALTIGVDDASSKVALLTALLGCINSFVFDYLLRLRLSANNLNWFILKECLAPDLLNLSTNARLLSAVTELCSHPALQAEGIGVGFSERPDSIRRMKLRAYIEAVVARAYLVRDDDLPAILRGCEIEGLETALPKPSSIDKGFHRLDLELQPQLRSPALFQRAFKLLQEYGEEWLFENLNSEQVLFSLSPSDSNNRKLIPNAISVRDLNAFAASGIYTQLPPDVSSGSLGSAELLSKVRNAASCRGYPLNGARHGMGSSQS
ncbi:MAG: hypothetical protein K2Y39_27265 [Candidatus Obscuribacterales bacterium]|nr:hypothetical protein [Candidatus Obscuribacterales bacterium]